MKIKIILVIIAILFIFILFNIDYSIFREKTDLEKTHLRCLTGITSKSIDFEGEFGIRGIYLAWEDNLPENISTLVKESESVLMITWEPYLKDNKSKSILNDILSGKYDSLIGDFASELKKYNHSVLLRWGHEMNGNWYSWSGEQNDKNTSLYIKSFQHIHDIFQQKGDKNVKFVFSVDAKDVPSITWNRFENYYPGDEYVDIIGIDFYNWGSDATLFAGKIFGWENPEKILKPPYERIIKNYPHKPIMISEVGSSSSGGDKIKWMKDFFYLLKTRFTAIKAFVWFDINKETDWAISHDENIWKTYKEETKDSFFSNNASDFNWIFGS